VKPARPRGAISRFAFCMNRRFRSPKRATWTPRVACWPRVPVLARKVDGRSYASPPV